ncbi:hypothetical protein, partial [Klebsiella variicola]|uniref:hypothetical protein n=1 Tax=Klebsiella variicola TaxID=244366 RepID=UPI0013CFDA14
NSGKLRNEPSAKATVRFAGGGKPCIMPSATGSLSAALGVGPAFVAGIDIGMNSRARAKRNDRATVEPIGVRHNGQAGGSTMR